MEHEVIERPVVRRLIGAIVHQALRDWSSGRDGRHYREARRFFFDRARQDSTRSMLEVVGLDLDAVRESLRRTPQHELRQRLRDVEMLSEPDAPHLSPLVM